MEETPRQLNVVPLKELAVLPGNIIAFKVGRQASKLALLDALNSHRRLALFPQKDFSIEHPTVEDLHAIGCLCEVTAHAETGEITKVVVQGIKRVRIASVVNSTPYFVIETVDVVETTPDISVVVPPKKAIQEAVSLILKYKPDANLEVPPIPYDSNPGTLADNLVMRLRTSYENQLACLLELNPRQRLNLAYEILVREGHQAQLESEINEQVTVGIRDAHREIFLRGQLKVILQELGTDSPVGLYEPIFRGKSFKVDPKLAFVLMPLAESFRPIFTEIIKPGVAQFGLSCIRADDLYGAKAIIEDIWRLINEATIIIADVTGKNPNVFYEIGLAHVVGKDVIIISQSIDDVPFDLRHLRCLIYQDSVAGFRRLETQLQNTLNSIESLPKPTPPS